MTVEERFDSNDETEERRVDLWYLPSRLVALALSPALLDLFESIEFLRLPFLLDMLLWSSVRR